MSEDVDDRSVSSLDDACSDVLLALALVNARLDRFADLAFENSERAIKQLIRYASAYGAEGAITLLEDRGAWPRSHYFGHLRGHLFARAARVAATSALASLPEALREREVLIAKRDDLLRARRTIIERESFALHRETFEHERPTGRRR